MTICVRVIKTKNITTSCEGEKCLSVLNVLTIHLASRLAKRGREDLRLGF